MSSNFAQLFLLRSLILSTSCCTLRRFLFGILPLQPCLEILFSFYRSDHTTVHIILISRHLSHLVFCLFPLLESLSRTTITFFTMLKRFFKVFQLSVSDEFIGSSNNYSIFCLISDFVRMWFYLLFTINPFFEFSTVTCGIQMRIIETFISWV